MIGVFGFGIDSNIVGPNEFKYEGAWMLHVPIYNMNQGTGTISVGWGQELSVCFCEVFKYFLCFFNGESLGDTMFYIFEEVNQ